MTFFLSLGRYYRSSRLVIPGLAINAVALLCSHGMILPLQHMAVQLIRSLSEYEMAQRPGLA
jgi:hypothetical protein